MFDDLDRLLASSISDDAVESSFQALHDGERRIVSILFADVKGFTVLSEKLDPEQVRMIMDKLLQLFTICIKNYGGYIDKYEGDLVMALFGAKVASERDTERCIRAALDMLDKLKLFNDILRKSRGTENIQLDIRIGINTGLVTTGRVGEKREGDFTVYGEAVNLASRMEKYAPVNSIMLPKEARNIVKDVFDFSNNGTKDIRGKEKSVDVFLVKGLKRKEFFHRDNWKFPFLGRKDEIDILTGRYQQLTREISCEEPESRIPTVIALRANAGLGKTRLISEFLKRMETVLDINPIIHAEVPNFAQTPYCLFTEIIKTYMNISRSDSHEQIGHKFDKAISDLSRTTSTECSERISNDKPILGFLLGLKYEDTRLQLEPRILKDHILISIRHFFEAVAESVNQNKFPLTVILEDLQWIDEASNTMLDFLFKTLNLENKREGRDLNKILFIISYRPEFQLPDSWRSASDLTEIELKPLTEKECVILLGMYIEDMDLSVERKQELLIKSEGNPFYLEEWVNLLTSSEKMHDDIRKLPIPDSLTALMLSRIDRLEKDVKLLLQKASVNGMNFTSDVLTYIEKQLNRFQIIDDQLNQLSDSEFVYTVKNDLYSFKHAITRDVSYNTMLIANRRILHRLIGEFIETEYSDKLAEMYPALAYHFEHAAETAKAILYLNRAADLAQNNFDSKSAIGFFDSLLSIYDGLLTSDNKDKHRDYITEIIKILLNKGKLLEPLGRWDECKELYERALKLAESITDRGLAAQVKSNMGVIFWRKGKIEEAINIINKALAVFEEENDDERITRAILNIGNINLLKGNYDKSIECYKHVVEYYDKVNQNEHYHSLYIGNLGIAYSYKCMYPEAEECYSKQLAICEKLGDRHGLATVTANMGELYRNTNALNKAMEYFNRSYRLFEELGDINRCGISLGNIGAVLYIRGDFKGALKNYENALEILKQTGDKYHEALFTGNSAITLLNMKNYDKASAWFSSAVAKTEILKSNHLLTYWLSYQAENLLQMEEFTKAFEVNEKATKIAEEIGNATTLSKCRIISYKIKFELLKENARRDEECIKPLLQMLSESESKADNAFIHYELTGMLMRIGSTELSGEHRKKAMETCKELLLENEYFEWRKIIEELER